MRWLTLLVVLFVLGPRLAAAFPQPDADEAYAAGDYQTAFRIWLSAAENGSSRAQANIGRMYERGEGVTQDRGAAEEWYRRAAEQSARDGTAPSVGDSAGAGAGMGTLAPAGAATYPATVQTVVVVPVYRPVSAPVIMRAPAPVYVPRPYMPPRAPISHQHGGHGRH